MLENFISFYCKNQKIVIYFIPIHFIHSQFKKNNKIMNARVRLNGKDLQLQILQMKHNIQGFVKLNYTIKNYLTAFTGGPLRRVLLFSGALM